VGEEIIWANAADEKIGGTALSAPSPHTSTQKKMLALRCGLSATIAFAADA